MNFIDETIKEAEDYCLLNGFVDSDKKADFDLCIKYLCGDRYEQWRQS